MEEENHLPFSTFFQGGYVGQSGWHFSAKRLKPQRVKKPNNFFIHLGTKISPFGGTFESMIFIFPKWDMLVPWRVSKFDPD